MQNSISFKRPKDDDSFQLIKSGSSLNLNYYSSSLAPTSGGSLNISQDVVVGGGITGSLQGNADTATSASYALTASYASSIGPLTQNVSINGNLNVIGTASFTYTTASIVKVGSNTIILNTNYPASRFGGITVIDSGSFGNSSTGSLFWDSLRNTWVYSNPAGASYSGGMLISGPRNTGSLGDESGLTANYVTMGAGEDHLNMTTIFHSASITIVTGSLQVTAGITGSLSGSALTAVSSSYATSASYVQNAVSSSYANFAVSASNSTTASYIQNAVSASYATSASNAISSSYATTASLAPNYVLTSTTASMLSPYVLTSQTSSMSVASSSVAVSASYAPNLYIADGTLTGNRTISAGTGPYTLTINPATTFNGNPLTISGNQTAAAWGLNGIGLKSIAATYTDNTSTSGTVTNAAFHVLGTPTITTSTGTVTYSNLYSLYIKAPATSGTTVGTNKYSLGLEGGLYTGGLSWLAGGMLVQGSQCSIYPMINAYGGLQATAGITSIANYATNPSGVPTPSSNNQITLVSFGWSGSNGYTNLTGYQLKNVPNSNNNQDADLILYNYGSSYANTEYLRIKQSGSLLIGTPTDITSSIFTVASTSKGALLPRGTNANRTSITSPATGLLFYCTDATEGMYINKSGGWDMFGTLAATQSWSGVNTFSSNAGVTLKHLVGGSSTPTIVSGSGAGGTATVSISGTDLGGNITVTTGTVPTLSATVVTVTFAAAYSATPKCIMLTPANSTTSMLSGVNMVFVNQAGITTTTFAITSGTTALTAATTYQWFYSVIQ